MTRSRRTIFLTILLFLLGGTGLWFLGPAQWQGALDRAERRPDVDAVDRADEEARTPSLLGRPSEPPPAVVLGTETSGDLAVRFVVAGTDTPVPRARWEVRDDRLRASGRGGWVFTPEGRLFSGSTDHDGRAAIPAAAVAAWREHELFVHREGVVTTILGMPPAGPGDPVEIPLEADGE